MRKSLIVLLMIGVLIVGFCLGFQVAHQRVFGGKEWINIPIGSGDYVSVEKSGRYHFGGGLKNSPETEKMPSATFSFD